MGPEGDRWDTFAEVLSHCGGMATRLVAQHVDDGTGRCIVCSEGGQAGRYTWPCAIRRMSTTALHLQARRLAQGTAPLSLRPAQEPSNPDCRPPMPGGTTSEVIDPGRARDHDR